MTPNTPATLWAAALGQLQVSVNKPNYDTWLRDTVGLRFDGQTCVVGANNDFTTEWLDVRMRKVILQALARVAGRTIDVTFEVLRPGMDEDAEAALVSRSVGEGLAGASDVGDAVPNYLRRIAAPPDLHPALTFDTFVVGEENQLAHNAARAAADTTTATQSPLVIFGGPGLGKTHLLNAVGHAAVAANKHVVYATAERFGTEFGFAAQHKSFDKFRRKFRDCDVLLIDDIQFLETRPGFQEEFFHTFNDLHAAGKQVVVTCDRLPAHISGLTEALRSRLMWGMQADLQKPSFATRLNILREKAAHHAIRLPEAALNQIAERCCPTVRELEGYLNRVLAHIPLVGGVATPEVIDRALAVFTNVPQSAPLNVAQPASPVNYGSHGPPAVNPPGTHNPAWPTDPSLPAPQTVIAAVCARTNTTPADLAGRSRSRDVSYARHLAMYILRNDATCTVAEIQRLFGNRDHSTVIGAIDRITGELATRPETKTDLTQVRQSITEALTAQAPAPTATEPATPAAITG